MSLALSDGITEGHITARALRTCLDRIPGKKMLFIDACHSGAMLGKGVTASFDSMFTGDDYIVVCSSGGAEQSWFWSGEDDATAGAGYFTSALTAAIGPAGGFGADVNRDGVITLTELRRFLLNQYGVSTPRFYPEESDEPILYPGSASALHSASAITNVDFDSTVADDLSAEFSFSFTVQRPVRTAYQLVYRQDNAWDFAGTTLIWDDEEGQGELLSPGYKERSITIGRQDEHAWGYVLVQLLTV